MRVLRRGLRPRDAVASYYRGDRRNRKARLIDDAFRSVNGHGENQRVEDFRAVDRRRRIAEVRVANVAGLDDDVALHCHRTARSICHVVLRNDARPDDFSFAVHFLHEFAANRLSGAVRHLVADSRVESLMVLGAIRQLGANCILLRRANVASQRATLLEEGCESDEQCDAADRSRCHFFPLMRRAVGDE